MNPTRSQFLSRDLQQVREHAAETALFNRPSPSLVVRQQLEQYRINQAELEAERQYRREDGYQPPAPVWVQWSVMIPASLLATYAVIEFALHVLPAIQNFVRSIP